MAITKLGKSRELYLSRLKSAWEDGLVDAIKKARQGKPDRLIALLRAHRPLAREDFDALADLLEQEFRGVGQPRNNYVHKAAQLIKTQKNIYRHRYNTPTVPKAVESEMLEESCQLFERESGEEINRESVRYAMRRSAKLR
ncbi:MAG: hypothetical protein KKB66_11355 [Alphaproteobacteria bacterium]|nr:hypothetical protein [Alphaproteobacteria bacterium]MBU0804997.1 hypothetical protein [Alphaproteobacteria bacterium]MBU0870496.1 hypothetical protein [Alphaproteobacteria bacterium]MBU1401829.1 hypothetical protein [Alphaproteobacteria bacterium]MBU1591754.1 hypothetical protein [Alphaproteobacteria bacterium]